MPAEAADEQERRRDDGAGERDQRRASEEQHDERQQEQGRAGEEEREQHQRGREEDDGRAGPGTNPSSDTMSCGPSWSGCAEVEIGPSISSVVDMSPSLRDDGRRSRPCNPRM